MENFKEWKVDRLFNSGLELLSVSDEQFESEDTQNKLADRSVAVHRRNFSLEQLINGLQLLSNTFVNQR